MNNSFIKLPIKRLTDCLFGPIKHGPFNRIKTLQPTVHFKSHYIFPKDPSSYRLSSDFVRYLNFLMAGQYWRATALSLWRIHDHTKTHHTRRDSSGRVIGPSQRPLPDNTQQPQKTNVHAPSGIGTRNPSRRATPDRTTTRIAISYLVSRCKLHVLHQFSAAARFLGLWVRIPPGGDGFLSLVNVVCCQVEVSVTGRSLVQRSPTECGVSECDRKPR
jgi:hypothetical protein